MLTRRTMLAAAAASLLPLPALAMTDMTLAYDPAAFAAAQASGNAILVEIHASWCGTCKAQKAVLSELLKQPSYKDVAVFRVDYDGQKDAVKGFGARMQSTLIMFKGKAETARLVGETDTGVIEGLLKSAI